MNVPIIYFQEFLAAMSSSRSDDVTKSVCLLVVIFLVWIIQCIRCKMFQGFFKEVLKVFQGSFKGVYRKFQGCLQKVSRVFQGSFKSVSRNFQECFKEVSVKFSKHIKIVSRLFKVVLGEFQEYMEEN